METQRGMSISENDRRMETDQMKSYLSFSFSFKSNSVAETVTDFLIQNARWESLWQIEGMIELKIAHLISWQQFQ